MLTEKETILRAKMHLEKLSAGIDPLTDAPVPESDTVYTANTASFFMTLPPNSRSLITLRI